jgi:hypothetical protein
VAEDGSTPSGVRRENAMSISTVSFAVFRFQGSALPAAPAPAPTAAPAPAAADASGKPSGDSPRASLLYRALMDALENLASTTATPPAPASGAATAASATSGAPPSAGASATAADAVPGGDLQDALAQFAHVLAAALRAVDGKGQGHANGHHRHHHGGHGQDPASRLQSLAARVGAEGATSPATKGAADASSTTSNSATTGTTAGAAPTTPAHGASTSAPAPAVPVIAAPTSAVTPSGAAPQADSSLIVVVVPKGLGGQAASPFAGYLDRLMDSFARLQQAMDKPPAQDEKSLQAALATFLRDLAARLTAETTVDPTAPGALIHLAA